jgi:hypothetical protein
MLNPIPHPVADLVAHNEEFYDDEYSQAAELAWEFCNKVRHGGNPSKQSFYARLSGQKSKDEFDFLVNMNQFVEFFAEFKAEK